MIGHILGKRRHPTPSFGLLPEISGSRIHSGSGPGIKTAPASNSSGALQTDLLGTSAPRELTGSPQRLRCAMVAGEA